VALVAGVLVALVVLIAWDRYAPSTVTIEPGPIPTMAIVIEGAVATPGVVYLPAGARLADAVSAAGGLLGNADLSQLNFAGRITDGERITIPTKADSITAVDPSPGGTPVSRPDGTGLLNINTASAVELDQLPGIGPAIAQRIIDFREFYGPFTSIDQLAEVDGISPAMVEELRPLVTTGD